MSATPRERAARPRARAGGVLNPRQRLALDLGTSAVRLWTPQAAAAIVEPAVIARMPDGRRVAGRAAAEAAVADGAKLISPIREGTVRDFAACVDLLRVLVARTGQSYGPECSVLVGVPATATVRQGDLLAAVVRRAVGGRVTTVEQPLAAALACGLGPATDDLVTVDIGSGRIEVARIADSRVTGAVRVHAGNALDPVHEIARCVRGMNVREPGVRRRRLVITGGGAMSPGLAARLAAWTGRSVTMPADPLLATLTGIRLLLTA
ncbi:rod shape-determining protein [Dactylosporangium roseum]|uniref:Rod shape-determining protein n=1 Tax=Dactylosporangium roseum TaxID=47989 RepID=A0ABY5YZN1_9ACTN|nr:rod shape-determining protein [Dactylosporangium roseum]UWZ34275.1 rod shape-determining protein [Dactylosporangium roseum]